MRDDQDLKGMMCTERVGILKQEMLTEDEVFYVTVGRYKDEWHRWIAYNDRIIDPSIRDADINNYEEHSRMRAWKE